MGLQYSGGMFFEHLVNFSIFTSSLFNKVVYSWIAKNKLKGSFKKQINVY